MLLAALAIVLCTAWVVVGFATVCLTTRRLSECSRSRPATESESPPPRETVRLPPVTVLKPLCGVDADLEENLRSMFEQTYPSFDLVFGVEDEHDPAIAVVSALGEQYPHVPARLIVHEGGTAINPKVRNLVGMVPFATNDLVIVSDSNVRAPRDYVYDMVLTFCAGERRAGLVTNLFAGTGETSLGSALENVQLNGFCAAGAAVPTSLGDALVVGKSMLFSRRVFAELGGFERVADVLAEDYVIGKMFQHAGYDVRLAAAVLENVTRGMTCRDFVQRHLRWAMLRWRLRPAAYLLEVVTSPVAMLPLAWAAVGPWALAWAWALLVLRDAGQWILLRGAGRAWIPVILAPLRDLFILFVWLWAPFKRHVTWRGKRARLGAGTILFRAPA